MAAVSVKRSIGHFPAAASLCFKARLRESEATDMKMIFHSHSNKTHLYKKGFALSLVLKVRVFATRDSIRKKIKKVVMKNIEATLAKDWKIFR